MLSSTQACAAAAAACCHFLLQGLLSNENISCTACAGTLLLEFGLLSRLTGNSSYLEAAHHAALLLFSKRSSLGLVGSGFHVFSRDWSHRDSTIGPGSDSYYEYLLKVGGAGVRISSCSTVCTAVVNNSGFKPSDAEAAQSLQQRQRSIRQVTRYPWHRYCPARLPLVLQGCPLSCKAAPCPARLLLVLQGCPLSCKLSSALPLDIVCAA
jgi:hypothetical protein